MILHKRLALEQKDLCVETRPDLIFAQFSLILSGVAENRPCSVFTY